MPSYGYIFDEPLAMIEGRGAVSARQGGKRLDADVRGGRSLIEFNPAGGPVLVGASEKAGR